MKKNVGGVPCEVRLHFATEGLPADLSTVISIERLVVAMDACAKRLDKEFSELSVDAKSRLVDDFYEDMSESAATLRKLCGEG